MIIYFFSFLLCFYDAGLVVVGLARFSFPNKRRKRQEQVLDGTILDG